MLPLQITRQLLVSPRQDDTPLFRSNELMTGNVSVAAMVGVSARGGFDSLVSMTVRALKVDRALIWFQTGSIYILA